MKNLILTITIINTLFCFQQVYSQDGQLDTGFGTSGTVSSFLSTNTQTVYGAAVQSDDKIVIAGDGQGNENQDFLIARYNADGSSDNGFGTSGIVYVNIVSSGLDDANAVVIQPDGKIIVAGYSHYVDIAQRIVAVIRLNSDGTLDDSFDGDGIVTTDIADDEFNNFDEFGQAVALQDDGKIVVAGHKYLDFNGTTDREIMIIRYNSDGSLDPTFDTDGIVLTNFTGGRDECYGVAVQPDNKIVVTGRIQNSNYDLIVARYNSDGSLDTDFSTDGYDVIDFGTGDDVGNATAIDGTNKIVVAGIARNSNNDFALLRYNTDGTPDTGFDTDGIVTNDFSSSNDMSNSVTLLSDGKILAGGRSANNFALIRYNINGSIDTDFGTSGKTTTNLGGTDIIYNAVIQSDGKIVAAGTTFNFTDGPGLALARYSGSIAPLPVELTSFTANIINKNVQLRWQTATEINNYGFEVQKLSKWIPSRQDYKIEELQDLKTKWEKIGFVKGGGNLNTAKEYTFTDENIPAGNYLYRLKQIDNDGTINYSTFVEVTIMMPGDFILLQNYPNPFNPVTNFAFRISDYGLVTLKIYDVLGKEVATIVNKELQPGEYHFPFTITSSAHFPFASGVYYYTLTTGSFSSTKKMVILK